MGREEEIVNERKKKIQDLTKKGINPYAHNLENHEKRAFSLEIIKKYSNLKNEEISKSEEIIAGRVMFTRDFGKLAFAKIQDLKGNIQVVLQAEKTPQKVVDFFSSFVDVGDIIGVIGNPTKTRTGEVSILVKELKLLTKSILPLPDKISGLKDEEEKLRKRYLDIIMNSEVKELFLKKQKFWSTIRNFLLEKGFIEVETPVLETSAGGAAATPFATHHNALDLDVYLRISQGELWQKKLLVAGYEKTFEIGRLFRNEGMDSEHLQDYTSMEFYWAYANFEDGMKLTEELYKKVAVAVLGKLKFKTREFEIDLGKKWEIYDYEKIIEQKTGINIYKTDKKEIEKFLSKEKIEFEDKADKWRLVDLLWKYCRKQLSGPGFLVGQPAELTPLAKRSEKDPRKVEQFQIIIAGSEMGNGYSELNDPLDQEERFKKQQEQKEKGDAESMSHDFEFVEALKYAMPPACGFGVSERFFSYLVDKPIRECVMFPLMKPQSKSLSKKQEEELYRSKKVVVIADEDLDYGTTANAIGQLGISIGGHSNQKLFEATMLHDAENKVHYTDCFYPMANLAGSQKEMAEFVKRCYQANIQVFDFTDIMRRAHSDREMQEGYKAKKTSDLGYIAVGALIPKDFEKEFLSHLKLFGEKSQTKSAKKKK